MKIAGLLLLVAALAAVALTAPAAAQARKGLELSVTVPAKVRLDADTEIMVSLTNASPTAIDLPSHPGWDAEGGLSLAITQVNGARVAVPVQPEEPMRNAVRSRGRSKTPLPGGHGMDLFHTIRLADLVKAPGDYQLVVTYRRAGNTDLVSEPARFTITE